VRKTFLTVVLTAIVCFAINAATGLADNPELCLDCHDKWGHREVTLLHPGDGLNVPLADLRCVVTVPWKPSYVDPGPGFYCDRASVTGPKGTSDSRGVLFGRFHLAVTDQHAGIDSLTHIYSRDP
jgi:hypothetical protein